MLSSTPYYTCIWGKFTLYDVEAITKITVINYPRLEIFVAENLSLSRKAMKINHTKYSLQRITTQAQ